MNIYHITAEYLKANGFDGLCLPGECGCLLDDLMPCGMPDVFDCQAGYKGPPTPEGGDWAVYPSKESRDRAIEEASDMPEQK